MQTIALSKLQSDRQLFDRLAETLENEGLVCIPAASGYKLMADLSSPKAVNQLLQAKCRMTNGPALVFVPGQEWVDKLAADVTEEARKLMEQFWPGPVTLLFNAHPDALHPKVEKSLTKAKGWLGVRMPRTRSHNRCWPRLAARLWYHPPTWPERWRPLRGPGEEELRAHGRHLDRRG